jgi:hypothetical protein
MIKYAIALALAVGMGSAHAQENNWVDAQRSGISWTLPNGERVPVEKGIPEIILWERCPAFGNLDDSLFGTEAHWREHWPKLGELHLIVERSGLVSGLANKIHEKFLWGEKHITLIRDTRARAKETYARTRDPRYSEAIDRYRNRQIASYIGKLDAEERSITQKVLDYPVGQIKAYDRQQARRSNQFNRAEPQYPKFVRTQLLYEACQDSPYRYGNQPRPLYNSNWRNQYRGY